jgi:hypothetical protein
MWCYIVQWEAHRSNKGHVHTHHATSKSKHVYSCEQASPGSASWLSKVRQTTTPNRGKALQLITRPHVSPYPNAAREPEPELGSTGLG